MRKKEKKKKKKLGRWLFLACILAAVILAGLFLDLGGFGSQLGLPTFGPTEVEETPPPAEEEPPEDTPPQQAENGEGEAELAPLSLLIRVSGNSIFHGEEEITTAQLQDILREHDQPGHIWELRDEQAIMAVYEEVRMLLLELDVAFTETGG